MESQAQQEKQQSESPGAPEVQPSTTSPAIDSTDRSQNVQPAAPDLKNEQTETYAKEVQAEKSSSHDSGGGDPDATKGDDGQDLENGQPQESRKSHAWRRYRSQIRSIAHLVIFILFTG